MGFIEETGAAQYYRDVRITSIYEGTTGIQAIDLVGRKVSRDGGAAMSAFIAEMTAELSASAAADSSVASSRKAALEAVTVLQQATDVVLKQAARGTQYTQALAVPYLTLCGLVIGGWLLAKAQAVATGKLAEDPEFYAGKQQLCRFYVEQVLPQVFALKQTFIAGGDSIVDADPALF
jgi:hypothetical protein